MLEVNVTVNGLMVGHMAIINQRVQTGDSGNFLYRWEYYRFLGGGKTGRVYSGYLEHHRDEGAEVLVAKAIDAAAKARAEGETNDADEGRGRNMSGQKQADGPAVQEQGRQGL